MYDRKPVSVFCQLLYIVGYGLTVVLHVLAGKAILAILFWFVNQHISLISPIFLCTLYILFKYIIFLLTILTLFFRMCYDCNCAFVYLFFSPSISWEQIERGVL